MKQSYTGRQPCPEASVANTVMSSVILDLSVVGTLTQSWLQCVHFLITFQVTPQGPQGEDALYPDHAVIL